MMSAIQHTTFAKSVETAIGKQRPELIDQVVEVGDPTVGVKIQLSRDRSVMIGWVRDKSVEQWMIATPEPALIKLKSGETVDDIAARMVEFYDAFAD